VYEHWGKQSKSNRDRGATQTKQESVEAGLAGEAPEEGNLMRG
jgi:hypothetical protein